MINAARNKYTLRILIVAIITLTLSLAAPAMSQDQQDDGLREGMFGLRAGVGLKPDQFVVGAQVSLNEMFRITRFVPSVDVGFGDNNTTIAFNGDVFARLTLHGTALGLYCGGGPTVVFVDAGGSTSWEVGASLVGGIRFPLFRRSFNVEARFGFFDIPETRFLAGIFF